MGHDRPLKWFSGIVSTSVSQVNCNYVFVNILLIVTSEITGTRKQTERCTVTEEIHMQ